MQIYHNTICATPDALWIDIYNKQFLTHLCKEFNQLLFSRVNVFVLIFTICDQRITNQRETVIDLNL